jgi:hypothetical protein
LRGNSSYARRSIGGKVTGRGCFPTLAGLGRVHRDKGESNTRGGEEMDAVGRKGGG